MHLFLMSSLIKRDEQKGYILWGSKCCSCWVVNLYLIIINVFREEGCNFWLISGWFVQYLASLWVVCPVFGQFVGGLAGLWVVWLVCGWSGWFVGGLAGLWVVSSFTANDCEIEMAGTIFCYRQYYYSKKQYHKSVLIKKK